MLACLMIQAWAESSEENSLSIASHLGALGNVLLSQNPAVQVPSALEGLTVVFEMGTRGSPPPSSPNLEYSRKTFFVSMC